MLPSSDYDPAVVAWYPPTHFSHVADLATPHYLNRYLNHEVDIQGRHMLITTHITVHTQTPYSAKTNQRILDTAIVHLRFH
jgi:hypothetical protein